MNIWPIKELGKVCEFKPSKRQVRALLPAETSVSFMPMNELGIHQMYPEPADVRPLSEVAGSYTYFADGDVLLAKITPCFENGKLGVARGLSNRIGFGSSEFHVLRPGPEVLAEYVYYFLERDEIRERGSKAMTGAVGHRRVPEEFLEGLKIPVPPLEEQRRIVAVLDEAFAAIATATANAETNLANARDLFASELESLLETGGDDWTERPIGEVCKFIGGSQPPKAVFSAEAADDRIRLIQIRDYKSDRYKVFIPRKLAKRFCSPDDVMIGRYGPPLFQILRGIEGAYNVALMKASPNADLISKDFLYFFMRNKRLLNYIIAASSRAAGQIGLTKETLEPYPIRYPKLTSQAKIVDQLSELEARAAVLMRVQRRKLEALTALKQSLLHRAFTDALTATAPEAIAA
ncbi:restriction endonuclease subunit S [Rhizorhabdus argentea]|uniref:restriction endonuclease subunit S n=1 Tax=Rhizorhabdus argentea TaxID=1387174 RepID=UPI0030ED3D02